MLYYLLKIIVWLPMILLYPTSIKNKKFVKGKAVIVCNHLSNADIPIILNRIWFRPYILGKKELFKNKFTSGFFKFFRIIPVNRDKVEITTIKTSLNVLKLNKKLMLFPEGKRNLENNELGELKNGAIMFAIKTHSPIIPMKIINRPKLFHFNTIKVGKPFYVEEYYDKKLSQEEIKELNNLLSIKINEL